jgi:hypothetical protein
VDLALYPVLHLIEDLAFELGLLGAGGGSNAEIDVLEPALQAHEHVLDVCSSDFEGDLDLIGLFPVVEESRELIPEGKIAAFLLKEIHVGPEIPEGDFADHEEPGIDQSRDHRFALIDDAIPHPNPEFPQNLRDLDDAIGIIDLKSGRIFPQTKNIGRDFLAVVVLANHDAAEERGGLLHRWERSKEGSYL